MKVERNLLIEKERELLHKAIEDECKVEINEEEIKAIVTIIQ